MRIHVDLRKHMLIGGVRALMPSSSRLSMPLASAQTLGTSIM